MRVQDKLNSNGRLALAGYYFHMAQLFCVKAYGRVLHTSNDKALSHLETYSSSEQSSSFSPLLLSKYSSLAISP